MFEGVCIFVRVCVCVCVQMCEYMCAGRGERFPYFFSIIYISIIKRNLNHNRGPFHHHSYRYKLHKWCRHGWDGRFADSRKHCYCRAANWKQDAWVYLLMVQVLNVADEDGKR